MQRARLSRPCIRHSPASSRQMARPRASTTTAFRWNQTYRQRAVHGSRQIREPYARMLMGAQRVGAGRKLWRARGCALRRGRRSTVLSAGGPTGGRKS